MRPSRAAPIRRAGSTIFRFSPLLLGFLWVAIAGRRACGRPRSRLRFRAHPLRRLPRTLPQLALLSLPVMGYWALFLSHDQPYLRQVRFAVAMGGVAVLAFFVFLKQHLLDQRLRAIAQSFAQEFRQPAAAAGKSGAASQARFARGTGRARRQRTGVSALGHPEQFGAHGRQQQPQPRATRERAEDRAAGPAHARTGQRPAELRPADSGRKKPSRPEASVAARGPNGRIQAGKQEDQPDGGKHAIPCLASWATRASFCRPFFRSWRTRWTHCRKWAVGACRSRCGEKSNEVVVQFADSGPGLRDPERVFDPFYTTKPVGKGTGLGLSATYGVVQDHKGQITCYNRPEGGAAFEIRLPALKAGQQRPQPRTRRTSACHRGSRC